MHTQAVYWLGLALLASSLAPAPSKIGGLTKALPAPAFSRADVTGQIVDLAQFRGKKVLLTFYRNVGCPICNLRFHQLEQQADSWRTQGVVLLAVYESSADNISQYLDGTTPYTRLIPDPEQQLYKQYSIERSTGKLLKGMLHGAFSKMLQGKRLFRKKIKPDGHADRISAEFLIDEQGIIMIAHYGRYLGDHLPIDQIKDSVSTADSIRP